MEGLAQRVSLTSANFSFVCLLFAGQLASIVHATKAIEIFGYVFLMTHRRDSSAELTSEWPGQPWFCFSHF